MRTMVGHGDPPYGKAGRLNGDVTATKSALRQSALRARRMLDASERRQASVQAANRLAALPEMRRARTVLLYAALQDEADPSSLLPRLQERRVRTLFPRVRGEVLELVEARDLGTLTLGFRGIHEPVGRPVSPEVVDLAVIPGVAFDAAGGRLGQGGGHYDRLIPQLAATCMRVGFCFSCQMAARIPREPHDQTVDAVVTERAVHRPRVREEPEAT